MGLAQVLPEIPVLKASYATGHMFRMPSISPSAQLPVQLEMQDLQRLAAAERRLHVRRVG